MKKLLTTLLFAVGLASAQTTYIFDLAGNGCEVYGCYESPAMESDAPWGSNGPVFPLPPAKPFYFVQAHTFVTTNLPVKVSGNRPGQIPEHATSVGTESMDWEISNGTTGNLSFAVNCTWDHTGSLGTYPLYTEVCFSQVDANSFTRHWYATPGRFGFISLYEARQWVPDAMELVITF